MQANQYPWLVKLRIYKMDMYGIYGTFLCGGTLVASKYIISAAHCVHDDFEKVVQESDIKVFISNIS